MNADRFWYANTTATIPAAWHYTTGVFSLMCLFFGIISNGLVIFVFIKNKGLQKPRNYYLINLAITDIGLLLTNNSMHIISSFRKQWIFGQAGCNFYSVCGGVFGLTSIATMASISLTRLAAVNDPFSSLKLSSRFTLRYIACSWLYGSVWIMPPLFGWNRFILEGFATSCTFDYVSKDMKDRLFILILIIGGFLIPLSIILLSYTFILIKLSQRGRRFRSQNSEDQGPNQQSHPLEPHYFNQPNTPKDRRGRNGTTTTAPDSNNDRNMARNIYRTEARATRTALLICIVFCLAWGPYAVMALISLFGFDYLVNAYTTAILGIFTKVAACINPLIYALSLTGFREQLCSYIKCVCQSDEEHNRLYRSNLDLNQKTLIDTNNRPNRQSNSINRLDI